MSEEVWKSLGRLGHNWDGYGAAPLDPEMIFTAKKLLGRLSDFPPPHIVPGSTGSIQFEWDARSRSLEIEIEDLYNVHYLMWSPGEDIDYEEIIPIENIKEIREMVSWVHG